MAGFLRRSLRCENRLSRTTRRKVVNLHEVFQDMAIQLSTGLWCAEISGLVVPSGNFQNHIPITEIHKTMVGKSREKNNLMAL